MLVNQLAYIVIVRLATTANVIAAENGTTAGGLTSYTNAHLIFILPHSVITVSVVAALLPRMSRAAHAEDFTALAADIGGGMRSVSALIVPAAVALIVLGTQAGVLLFNYGATTKAEAQLTGTVASVLALGLLPFTLYYIVLRGWYALELTRTAFWVTVVLNALYLALAWPLFQWAVRSDHGSLALVALAAGYVGSYWITLVLGLDRAVAPRRRAADRPHPAGARPDVPRRARHVPRHDPRPATGDRPPHRPEPDPGPRSTSPWWGPWGWSPTSCSPAPCASPRSPRWSPSCADASPAAADASRTGPSGRSRAAARVQPGCSTRANGGRVGTCGTSSRGAATPTRSEWHHSRQGRARTPARPSPAPTPAWWSSGRLRS